MALIHQATLTPGKLDLLRAWLPTRPWFPAGAEVTALGAYRFDDPAGEVGVETFLLQAGAVVLQVPLTYRSGPLPGAEHALVGTTEHSVLGRRWVHDGTADPVWLAALVAAVLTGGTEAAEELEVDGRRQPPRPRRDRAGQRRRRSRGARAGGDQRPRRRADHGGRGGRGRGGAGPRRRHRAGRGADAHRRRGRARAVGAGRRRAPPEQGARQPGPTRSRPCQAASASTSRSTADRIAVVHRTSSCRAFSRSTPALRSAVASTLPTSRSPCSTGRAK